MITENLSTLKIHKLTQAQYDRELEAGRIDPSALYLTPEETGNSTGGNTDLTGYATEEWVQEGFQSKGNYLTTETDPTVPAWAKAATKPTYTASEIGLGNVDNTSDANKPVSTAQATAIADAKKAGTDAQSDLNTHTSNKSNPHGVTKAQVGLSNVDNVKQYSAINPPVAVQASAPSDTSVIWVDIDDNSGDEISNEERLKWESYIATELAKRGQLKPEFANSIEECTDITKLYVLPDGHIYAYMMTEVTEEVIAYDNKLPKAVASDDTPYNGGQGWKANTRLSSSGAEKAQDGLECIGFIPFTPGDVIRFGNIQYIRTSVNREKCYFIQYDANKTMLRQWIVSGFANAINNGWVFEDADTNVYQINTGGGIGDGDFKIHPDAKYFRINADEINADSIITINEEIKSTTITRKEYAWANTGHAFVPADYEDRIIAVEEANAENEERIDAHETRIENLESGAVNGIPGYVVTEAEEVIDKVIAAQGNRTFTFAAITDMHYGNGGYDDGVVHACQAMKYIDSRIKLDAVAVLGDYTDGMAVNAFEGAASDCKEINAVLDGLRFAPNFRLQGNHDFYAKHSPVIHRYIQAYSDDVVWGSRLGGYFYRDFEDFKLRVICLNTAEENKDGVSCTTEQYNWFAGVIDLSSKADMADWQTLILSHHPLDWFYSNNSGYVFWQILSAYLNGTSWNGFNFAGKNSPRIVGNIHGHIHNLLTRKIAAGQPNTTESTINVVRIATPEACYNRPNGYNGLWDYNPFGEDVSYPKTKDTAEDTAFCIYCIDLDSHTIKAICYGAGYDREISY